MVAPHHPSYASPRSAGGFTYLGLLFFVAVVGFALAAVAVIWHTYSQREREAELLFIGDEFRRAIQSYRTTSPGAAQYPTSLEDLLRDPRFPTIKRHLRRMYRDPLTGQAEWGLVTQPDKRIVGVYSLSEDVPRKTDRFPPEYAQFARAATYKDWKFIDVPPAAQPSGRPAPPGSVTAPAVPPGVPVGDVPPPVAVPLDDGFDPGAR